MVHCKKYTEAGSRASFQLPNVANFCIGSALTLCLRGFGKHHFAAPFKQSSCSPGWIAITTGCQIRCASDTVPPMSDGNVFAVVLAAGQASRFGATKQLALYDDAPLVTRAVRLAESVCGPRTILVAGHDWAAVTSVCAPLQGYFVLNGEYAEGMASSIAAGVAAVAGVADAILLLLADQPLITPAHLRTLTGCWQKSPDSIVASAYAATSGPPLIFPRQDFAALQALRGDRGAHSIIEAAADRVLQVELSGAALDIDRPEDLPPR
jgi:CTP:molybdopterin cytidylyltransferase MocA